jgi:hypothetical protein
MDGQVEKQTGQIDGYKDFLVNTQTDGLTD